MKTLVAVFLAIFTVVPAQAGPQPSRIHFQHASAFRPHPAGTHFIARSGNGSHRHFAIFDPLGCGSSYGLPADDTVYQGQVAPKDSESLPYATSTSDPEIMISPYEPHTTISVAGIPHGANMHDPVSNLFFLNP
jgi:hypothetical protein